jgi:menaquinone-specific isochorismate synthase
MYSPEKAKQIIAEKLEETFKQAGESMVRVDVEIEKQDLLKWLLSQSSKTKVYFSGRDEEDIETAGIGSADTVLHPYNLDYAAVFQHIRKRLTSDYPDLRYYGGLAFAPGHTEADWEPFGACRFTVPRFELFVKNNRTFLACNVLLDKEKPDSLNIVLDELEQLNFRDYREFFTPGNMVSRTDSPGYEQWIKNLTSVIAEIREGKYQKTVLARKVLVQFETSPEPVSILSFLKRLPTKRYDFLFQVDETNAFLGSSPERLYKRSGRSIASEAVAGTRVRGKMEQDDIQLAEELMASGKEQLEHDFVIDAIEEVLQPLCTSLEKDNEKSLLKLKETQHLISQFKGILKEGVTDDMLLETLHPTPAVGGCPLKEALRAIDESEPFKRGWYAGVIGTVGHDDCDFAVGLRSGRIDKTGLSLYSGVGIVEGSDPVDEWYEVDSKITTFMEMFMEKVQNENK